MVERYSTQLRAWSHVLQNRLARKRGKVPLPRAAWLIPTWYCDLACITCGVWRRPRESTDLSPAQWRTVMAKLKFLDVVKLLGGEPFTREDLPDIGLAVQEIIRPFVFHVVTAGKETARILEFAARVGAPNLHLRVSMDGLGEVHEHLRGTPGLHAATRATLEGLLPLRDRLGFHIGVNVAVHDQTLPHLAELAEFCHTRHISIIPGLAITPFLEDRDPALSPPRVLMASDPQAVRRALNELTRGGQGGYRWLERLGLKSMNDKIFDEMLAGNSATVHGPRCEALRSSMYVLPDGGVAACGLKHGSVGNLLTHSFDEVWHGEAASRSRQEVAACVGCLQHSESVFSWMYGGAR